MHAPTSDAARGEAGACSIVSTGGPSLACTGIRYETQAPPPPVHLLPHASPLSSVSLIIIRRRRRCAGQVLPSLAAASHHPAPLAQQFQAPSPTGCSEGKSTRQQSGRRSDGWRCPPDLLVDHHHGHDHGAVAGNGRSMMRRGLASGVRRCPPCDHQCCLRLRRCCPWTCLPAQLSCHRDGKPGLPKQGPEEQPKTHHRWPRHGCRHSPPAWTDVRTMPGRAKDEAARA